MAEIEQIEDERVYSMPAVTQVNTGAAGASGPGPGVTDDLALADEEMVVDDNAAPSWTFAAPPPEAGNPYLARIHRGAKGLVTVPSDDHKSIKYLMDYIDVELLSDKAGASVIREGRDKGPSTPTQVTTMRLGESNPVRDLLVLGLRKPAPQPQTHRSWGQALWDALAGDPQVKAQIRWKSRCKDCSTKKENVQLVGERNFQQKPDGSHDHVWKCPKCGQDVPANFEIVRWLPA